MLGFMKRNSVECAVKNMPEEVEQAVKFTEQLTPNAKLDVLKKRFEKVEREARNFIEAEYPRLESEISSLRMILHREAINKYDAYAHLEPQQITECEQRIADLGKAQVDKRPELKRQKELRAEAQRQVQNLAILGGNLNFIKQLESQANELREKGRGLLRSAEQVEGRQKNFFKEFENKVNWLMDRENIEL